MTSKYTILLVLVLSNALVLNSDVNTCPANDKTCSNINILQREPNESLGKYLLRKNELINDNSASQPTTAMSIRMVNPNNKYYDVYWYNKYRNPSRIYKGPIKPKSARSTNSYVGHIFYFTERNADPKDELWKFSVVPDTNMYIMTPENKSDAYYINIMHKKEFYDNYRKENGIPWIHYYPRPIPLMHIWSVDEGIGHMHQINTNQTLWNCIPNDFNNPNDVSKCRDAGTIDYGIEIISQKPRIFVIENVISDAECQLIIDLATKKLKRSRAGGDGGLEDNTRTSRTAWLDRIEHPVIDTIFRRTADILNIDESLLHSNKNVESLQVVHYNEGQEYKAHHDFGDHGEPTSRIITLLFYLNDMIDDYSGGATMFPKANNDKGVAVHPGKGNAVMFYSLLPDGNGDEKSLHEAVKLLKGEKWICNFWVWSPHR